MLKVLHVITGLGRGGAEAVLYRLIGATKDDFLHCVISLRDQGCYGAPLRESGIQVHTLGMGYGMGNLRAIARLINIVRREKPDVVQTWMYHADVLGGLAARAAGCRTVIWGIRNSNLSSRAVRFSTRLVAWVAGRLSYVVPNAIVSNSTEAAESHIRRGYRANAFVVVPNGYDLNKFCPRPDLREGVRAEFGIDSATTLLGMVARWDPQKDHANLLTAFQLVAADDEHVTLMLVGDGMTGENEALSAMMTRIGIRKRVILAGPRSDIPAIMNALDVHVLSSLGEAFPNVLAEAMACGTPCVTTDVGDAALIVGSAGWVAPARDPGTLGRCMKDAIAAIRQGDRSNVAVRCRSRIVDKFDLHCMTDAFSDLWRKQSRQQH